MRSQRQSSTPERNFRGLKLARPILGGAVAVWLTIVVAATGTAGAWLLTQSYAEAHAYHRFETRAQLIKAAIGGRLLDYEQVLRGTQGLFAASKSVERDEWRAYVARLELQQSYPGILAIGFSPLIPAAQLKAHIRQVRAEGLADYTVHPEGERPVYTAIVYHESFDGFDSRVFGYDMFSDSARRAAMERARDTGMAAISGKLVLIQDTESQPGFVMYLPVYRNGASIDTVDARRTALVGYVYCAFRMANLIDAILGERQASDVDLEISDGAGDSDDSLMYRRAQSAGHRSAFVSRVSFPIAGRSWTLKFSSNPAVEATIDEDTPAIVLTTGLFISALLIVLAATLSNRRAAALGLARQMSAEAVGKQAELKALSDSSPVGLFRTDSAGACEYVNPTYEVITGMSGEEAMGEGWIQAIHPEDRERVVRNWAEAARANALYEGEHRVVHADGTVKWVSAKAAPVATAKQPVGYVGTLEDITFRKRAEETLRAAKERLELGLEGSNLALFEWNIETSEVYLSEGWAVMLGEEPKPTQTTILALRELVPAEDQPMLAKAVSDALKGESPYYQVEHRVKAASGQWKWIQSHGRVSARDAEGRALRLTGTNADITERKAVEQMKNEFVATVSHELRTPLTAIIGSLALLHRETQNALSADVGMLINLAYQNSERLASLINDILDMEKIEAGLITFRLQPVELEPFLVKAIQLNRPYADKHGVRFALKAPVPQAKLRADPEPLMQVLANLLSNAAKFSPAGEEVEIHAEATRRSVRVEVADRGPGVPEEFQGRLFQKFAQADSSSTRQKDGTGLGLSISRAIIGRMGGSIGYSAAGKGATFYFELPLWGERAPVLGSGTDSMRRILICDNERDVASLMGTLLTREGFVTDIAYSVAQVREMLELDCYCALVLDPSLPEGIEFLKTAKGETWALAIVVVSADAAALKAQGVAPLVREWLDKPFDREKLVAAVNRVVAAPKRSNRGLEPLLQS